MVLVTKEEMCHSNSNNTIYHCWWVIKAALYFYIDTYFYIHTDRRGTDKLTGKGLTDWQERDRQTHRGGVERLTAEWHTNWQDGWSDLQDVIFICNLQNVLDRYIFAQKWLNRQFLFFSPNQCCMQLVQESTAPNPVHLTQIGHILCVECACCLWE